MNTHDIERPEVHRTLKITRGEPPLQPGPTVSTAASKEHKVYITYTNEIIRR